MIRKIEKRISEYVGGGGREVKLEGDYEIIGTDNQRNENNGWTFTREHGAASRMMMYLDGINTFVSLVGTKKGGWNSYVIIKKTEWDKNFCLSDIFDRLNNAEGAIINKNNFWGGSNMRGGSPRQSWSKLKPKTVEEIVNESVEEMKSKL
jgi:hypothetical protein